VYHAARHAALDGQELGHAGQQIRLPVRMCTTPPGTSGFPNGSGKGKQEARKKL
jgi:hypothetical protein